MLERLRLILSGVRTRILASYVVLLAFATFGTVLVERQVLLSQLTQRIYADLEQGSKKSSSSSAASARTARASGVKSLRLGRARSGGTCSLARCSAITWGASSTSSSRGTFPLTTRRS
jgi:hypothetical protein